MPFRSSKIQSRLMDTREPAFSPDDINFLNLSSPFHNIIQDTAAVPSGPGAFVSSTLNSAKPDGSNTSFSARAWWGFLSPNSEPTPGSSTRENRDDRGEDVDGLLHQGQGSVEKREEMVRKNTRLCIEITGWLLFAVLFVIVLGFFSTPRARMRGIGLGGESIFGFAGRAGVMNAPEWQE